MRSEYRRHGMLKVVYTIGAIREQCPTFRMYYAYLSKSSTSILAARFSELPVSSRTLSTLAFILTSPSITCIHYKWRLKRLKGIKTAPRLVLHTTSANFFPTCRLPPWPWNSRARFYCVDWTIFCSSRRTPQILQVGEGLEALFAPLMTRQGVLDGNCFCQHS